MPLFHRKWNHFFFVKMVCRKRFSALYEIHLIKTILPSFFIKIVIQFLCTFQKALLLFSRMLYTTSPTCILYQPNKKNKLTITYYIFELKKHCHFFKKALASNWVLSTNHAVFIKFTTGKSRQASFQIMWRIGMPKQIPLQKSKQLFRWNRRPDKI